LASDDELPSEEVRETVAAMIGGIIEFCQSGEKSLTKRKLAKSYLELLLKHFGKVSTWWPTDDESGKPLVGYLCSSLFAATGCASVEELATIDTTANECWL
jgi:hypothetical protein